MASIPALEQRQLREDLEAVIEEQPPLVCSLVALVERVA